MFLLGVNVPDDKLARVARSHIYGETGILLFGPEPETGKLAIPDPLHAPARTQYAVLHRGMAQSTPADLTAVAVAEARLQTGKHATREPHTAQIQPQCVVLPYGANCQTSSPPPTPPPPSGGIADWQTCYPGSTYCTDSAAVCCIASGDGSKYTCRPYGANCQSSSPPPPPPSSGIADWQTCIPGTTTCASSNAVCCNATGDGSKYTCRPNAANCQASAPRPPPPSSPPPPPPPPPPPAKNVVTCAYKTLSLVAAPLHDTYFVKAKFRFCLNRTPNKSCDDMYNEVRNHAEYGEVDAWDCHQDSGDVYIATGRFIHGGSVTSATLEIDACKDTINGNGKVASDYGQALKC
ncbi:hypothetical protein M427DRAFT_73907 [Gonapodya prolifera JEL478]|uniref:Uncharacterized protein n=1 Tax=Gonapodya prolifera (strain JEL478) TaxID=1344416 RepID=A0A139A147_GONPJ|nr:hypothetical protein M427DRAFT_73907 [Gonapodya prolifera JEL478]|eukprot:KXS10507.1 hypothetical protein M427DRAFT_73907 [Gonapodya prolifera JEL478]